MGWRSLNRSWHDRINLHWPMVCICFDCFRGTVGDRQLQVTVLPAYEEEPYPAEIDLLSFYSLRRTSASDRAPLAACKAEPLPIATQPRSQAKMLSSTSTFCR
ncbi:hypothetical protein [Thermosynechococcus sp.]|uniref:hypothetical protein n=1 Tax=Thermosynechococcus sp. TaxID=2814275 RepID=UPI0039188767